MRRILFGFILFVGLGCGELEQDESGNVTAGAEADIPIVPVNLPIFATQFTLTGLGTTLHEKAEGIVGSLLSGFLPSASSVESQLGVLDAKLVQVSESILSPGALTASFSNQVEALSKVEVVQAGVTLQVTNSTSGYIATPASFALYLGEAADAEGFTESALINFTNREEIIKPGEAMTYTLADVPHIADLLNRILAGGESVSIGLGYQTAYRLADSENGADVALAATNLTGCFGALAGFSVPGINYFSTDRCPSPSEILGWKLVINKLDLHLKVKAELFTAPEIPSCSEYTAEQNLSTLADACPSE